MGNAQPKQLVYGAMYYTGAHVLFRQLRAPLGAIFMFHRVVASRTEQAFSPNAQFAVTTDELANIIANIRAAGYEIVALDEAVRRLDKSSAPSPPFVALTFDDGYRDNLELAYPICQKLDAPLTIYVATGFIDGTSPMWCFGLETLIARHNAVEISREGRTRIHITETTAEKHDVYRQLNRLFQQCAPAERQQLMDSLGARYDIDFAGLSAELALSWSNLQELADLPGVTIGAHSVSHSALRLLPESDARSEIAGSRAKLADVLRRPVHHFAFPFGDFSTTGPREFQLCQELGFASAVTSRHDVIHRAQGAQPFALPRVPTDPGETASTLRIKLSGMPGAICSLTNRFSGRQS